MKVAKERDTLGEFDKPATQTPIVSSEKQIGNDVCPKVEQNSVQSCDRRHRSGLKLKVPFVILHPEVPRESYGGSGQQGCALATRVGGHADAKRSPGPARLRGGFQRIDEVIVVDGHSWTARRPSLAAPAGRPHRRQTRKGKGNALVCGFAVATGEGGTATVDADGSAIPANPAFRGGAVGRGRLREGTRYGTAVAATSRARELGAACSAVSSSLVRYVVHGPGLWLQRGLVEHVPASARRDSAALEGDWAVYGDGSEVETLIKSAPPQPALSMRRSPATSTPCTHGVSNLTAAEDGRRVPVIRGKAERPPGSRTDSSALPHPVRPVPSGRDPAADQGPHGQGKVMSADGAGRMLAAWGAIDVRAS